VISGGKRNKKKNVTKAKENALEELTSLKQLWFHVLLQPQRLWYLHLELKPARVHRESARMARI
jgi:hypothetical protein